jgi:23S rRNA pseudouridine1911/1915/1917 synthase
MIAPPDETRSNQNGAIVVVGDLTTTETPHILYLDNQILAAIKPPGVLSQADGSGNPDMLTLLKADLKVRFNKPGDVFLGLLHRLDQPVGGVMLFAKTSKAASRLSAQIREHRWQKYYLAVVDGCPEPAAGRLEDTIRKDRQANRSVTTSRHEGQAAWLDYRRLEYRPDLNRSLLAIRLGTGRGHQIRLQLASRGWPIVGDRRYHPIFGETAVPGAAGSAGPRQLAGQPADPALWSCLLGCFHPVSGAWMLFGAPTPAAKPWSDFSVTDVRNLPDLFML